MSELDEARLAAAHEMVDLHQKFVLILVALGLTSPDAINDCLTLFAKKVHRDVPLLVEALKQRGAES